jgi:hypothetical protein
LESWSCSLRYRRELKAIVPFPPEALLSTATLGENAVSVPRNFEFGIDLFGSLEIAATVNQIKAPCDECIQQLEPSLLIDCPSEDVAAKGKRCYVQF